MLAVASEMAHQTSRLHRLLTLLDCIFSLPLLSSRRPLFCFFAVSQFKFFVMLSVCCFTPPVSTSLTPSALVEDLCCHLILCYSVRVDCAFVAGSTSTTRRTAARQIGEIAKQHPTELRPLLRRVSSLSPCMHIEYL